MYKLSSAHIQFVRMCCLLNRLEMGRAISTLVSMVHFSPWCPRTSSAVIVGSGSGRADSCQGKIKRVSAGAGERGASDEGPLRSNPTGWITWPLYNCVRGAFPTALSLLNRPSLTQRGSCLPPSLLSFPFFSSSPLLSTSSPFLSQGRCCVLRGVHHYLSSAPWLPLALLRGLSIVTVTC